jgi:putative PEP-CTERM system TPR-repeat lipoprotein
MNDWGGRHPIVAAMLAALAALSACTGRTDAEIESEALAEAQAALERKDTGTAIVTLKDLLERQPDSGAARLALAQALRAQGDAATAEIEFGKAEELGVEASRVVPARARALLASGKAAQVLERYRERRLGDPGADADLRVTLAIAAAARGEPALAERFLAEAASAGPERPRATLLRARLDLVAGRADAALARLQQAATTAAGTEAADMRLLEGEILASRPGRGDEAMAAFRHALQAEPGHVDAQRALVLMLLARGDTAGAQTQVTALERSAPRSSTPRLLRAMIDFERKDYSAARDKLQPLLAASPSNPVLLELAGATEFHLGALDKAETLLKTALERQGQALLARQTLARLYLRRGQADQVLETLAPLLQGVAPPVAALTMAGEAQLMLGEAAQAQRLFESATAREKDDAGAGIARGPDRPDRPGSADDSMRVRVALARLAQGEETAALADLQAIARRSPSTLADTALVAHHMRKRDWPRALAAIDALQSKQADGPAAPLLRGRVLSARGDFAGARASYEAALQAQPGLLPAVQGLAGLDIAEGKPEQARARLQALLAQRPGDAAVRLSLVEVMDRSGIPPAEVIAQLRQGVAASTGNVALRLRLVNTLLQDGQAASAKTAAAEAVAAVPGNAELLHAQGRAALAAGEHEQAVTIFNELAQRLPKSAQLQLDLASARIGQRDLAGAERHLRQALALAPEMALAQESLLATLLRRGRAEEALAFARDVQKRRPRSAAGLLFEGDVQSSRQRWDEALAAYRRALQLEPSGRVALRLHGALMAAGRSDEAERHANAWAAAHPQQLDFAAYLADLRLARGDLAGAEAAYRALVQRTPDHAGPLNNLAWLLARQGKPGALAMAERARAAAPYSAAVQDTLALALESEGQIGRAAEVQARLVERHPGNPDYRLRLAQLLIKTGDKAKARGELDALARLGERYPRQHEVAALQAQL